MEAFYGILIPFLGTSLGAACVFCMKKSLNDRVQRALTGFAAGVMIAASIWSLLIPAIEQSAQMGGLSSPPLSGSGWGCCSCWFWTWRWGEPQRTSRTGPTAPREVFSAQASSLPLNTGKILNSP